MTVTPLSFIHQRFRLRPHRISPTMSNQAACSLSRTRHPRLTRFHRPSMKQMLVALDRRIVPGTVHFIFKHHMKFGAHDFNRDALSFHFQP